MTKKQLIIVSSILLIMLGQCLYFAWDTGQTIDETFYNGSGYPMVRYNNYDRLGEHPPLVMQLGSLPLLLLKVNYPYVDAVYLDGSHRADGVDLSQTGSKFLYKKGNDPQIILFFERIPVIIITLLGGIVIFTWAYHLFGFSSALVSLVLYAFSSNMIGHGSLFTTDMAVAIFFFVSIYFSYRCFDQPSIYNAICVGVFAGLTLLSKISGLILFPTILSLFCVAGISQGELENKKLKNSEILTKLLTILSPIMFFCAATQKIAGVALGSLSLAAAELNIIPQFKARKKLSLFIRLLLIVGWIVMIGFVIGMIEKRPLPMVIGASIWCLVVFVFSLVLSRPNCSRGIVDMAKLFLLIWFVCAIVVISDFTDIFSTAGKLNFFRHYIRTFNIAFGHISTGHRVCIPGSFVTCDWKYFLASLLIKTPLTTLILSFAGLLILLISRVSTTVKAHLILPPLIFLLIASFMNKINIGIRHILPVYPFMFLMAGIPTFYLKQVGNRFLKNSGYLFVSVACVWVVLQNLSVTPHHLSYFNEFVGTPENGAKIVADSSLNFGQDNKRLADLVKEMKIQKVKISGVAPNPDLFDYYGISWAYMSDSDFESPDPGYYAIDVTVYRNIQDREVSWFKNKKPLRFAGKTFYLFKV